MEHLSIGRIVHAIRGATYSYMDALNRRLEAGWLVLNCRSLGTHLEYRDITPKHVRLTKTPKTILWDLTAATWAEFKAVKSFTSGTPVRVVAVAKHPLGGEYYLTQYSRERGIPNGFNVKDCTDDIDEA